MNVRTEYEAKWTEYQRVMHQGAWRIGWGFFGVTVGFLPLMWVFIWLVGPGGWERTLFHAPLLMWVAVPLCLTLVAGMIFHLYRKNLELDAQKRRYLAELKAIRSRLPHSGTPGSGGDALPEPDSFRHDD